MTKYTPEMIDKVRDSYMFYDTSVFQIIKQLQDEITELKQQLENEKNIVYSQKEIDLIIERSTILHSNNLELQNANKELIALLKEAESTNKGEDYYTRYSKYIKEN